MVEVGKDDNLRECLELLQGPIEKVEALLNALCAPLEALGVLPSKYKRYVGTSIQPGSRVTDRHISRIQVAVLQQVLSAWELELKRQGFADVLEHWLCPPYDASSKACSRIAVEAHTTTLSSSLNASSVQYLVRLVQRYPIHHLHEQMFDGVTMEDPKLQLRWEDLVRNVASIPAKAANASASQDFDLPVDLEQGSQFQQLCKSTEELIHAHCKHWGKGISPIEWPKSLLTGLSTVAISSITTLLSKLVRLDVFRTSPSYLPSQTSFFQTTLPTIRTRLGNDAGDVAAEIEDYAMFWSTLLSSLGSVIATQTITSSLIGHLDLPPSSQALDSSSTTRRLIKREASLIRLVIGNGKDEDSYAALASVALARDWDECHARVFVCFLSSKGVDGAPNDHHAGLEVLYKETLEVWTSPTHVKHSLLSKHRCKSTASSALQINTFF
jgi:telomere length regulation protein